MSQYHKEMKDNSAVDHNYFRQRLKAFLRERHPRLLQARSLITTRSNQAQTVYHQTLASGEGVSKAFADADAILYEGLIFSKYDTLRCILATEFPSIPTCRRRLLAMELEQSCEEIFSRYNLDDGMVARSEYNHLIVELIEAIRIYFDQNRILFKRTGHPTTTK